MAPENPPATIRVTILNLFPWIGSADIRYMPSMDLTLACLLILLGAMISYLLDEHFAFTARITAWIERDSDEN